MGLISRVSSRTYSTSKMIKFFNLQNRPSSNYKPHAHAKHFPIKRQTMLPTDTFKDKLILITGGGTGLGKAMATKFAHLNGTVIIASRKLPVLESAAAEINEKIGSNKIVAKQLDVRNVENITNLYDSIQDEFNTVPDVIINNAAGNFISPTERLSHSAFNNILDIVLKGTSSMTLEAGKRMIKADKPGVFLSITVPYATSGSAYVVPSACAKAGVEALTKSLAAEWGQYGIRMNAIAPGPIYTEGAFSRLDPTGAFVQKSLDKIPTGRLGETEEIANLATYLCSDYSSWTSGDIVNFDGGNIRSLSGMFDDIRQVPKESWDMIEQMIKGKAKSS